MAETEINISRGDKLTSLFNNTATELENQIKNIIKYKDLIKLPITTTESTNTEGDS